MNAIKMKMNSNPFPISSRLFLFFYPENLKFLDFEVNGACAAGENAAPLACRVPVCAKASI